MQRKPNSDRSNVLDRMRNNSELLTRKSLNKNEKEANPQYCGMNVLKHNSIQNMEGIEDQMLEILNQNVPGEENVGDIDLFLYCLSNIILSSKMSTEIWIFEYIVVYF